MPDEHHVLREKAREQMRAGRLTWREPDSILGAAGSGKACAVCGLVITRDHLECEIEISHDDWGSGKDIYHFHPRCFLAWDVERTKGGGL
jgi:hypothetical protein